MKAAGLGACVCAGLCLQLMCCTETCDVAQILGCQCQLCPTPCLPLFPCLPIPPPSPLYPCQAVVEDAFRDLHGKTLNFNSMVAAVGKLNRWYEDKGVLGQVGGWGAGREG